jgi:hypoxanthine phosphoribosyltransferase
MNDVDEIQSVLAEAELLFPERVVESAYDRMGREITAELEGCDPLVMCVLTGGIIPAAKLMQRMEFPMTLDVIHASRYHGRTFGSEIEWISLPRQSLYDRTVLIVDDILDEGVTLDAIRNYCAKQGAAAVLSAVLIDKMLGHEKPFQADFVGLEAENRYLFGCGMDYKGYWRNLPGIYACKDL